MTAGPSIGLRIFSGVHAGAEIVLAPGQYVIGQDDSCDLILADQTVAARHAVLTIAQGSAKDQPVSVHIASMDAPVVLDNQPVGADGNPWDQGASCLLGSVMLAWLPGDAQAKDWHDLIARLMSPTTPAASTNQNQEDTGPAAPEAEPEHSLLADENIGGNAPWLEHPKKQTLRKFLRFVILVLCLGSLAVSYEFSTRSPGISKEELIKIIVQNKFSTLSVESHSQFLALRGEVPSNEELARLYRLVQTLQYPVQLDVRVRADLIDALTQAFNSRGFFPEIVKAAGEKAFQVRGYMRDSQIEDAAFTSLQEDFPAITSLVLTRNIVYAKEVDAVVQPLLVRAELDTVQTHYHSGLILFRADLTPEQRERLDVSMAEAQQTLGVPLIFHVLAPDYTMAESAVANTAHASIQWPSTAPAPAPSQPDAVAPEINADISGVQVLGVTLSPMRFVELHSGEKVFEGGVLPSGHVLEEIGDKELKLRKNENIIIYKLRGAHE